MGAVLEDYQFELEDFVWGLGKPVFVLPDGFDPGDPDKQTQDQYNPRTGARLFGRDRTLATTWTWSCNLSTETPEDALDAAAEMGAVWRNEEDEVVTGSVKALRYAVAGRTRVVFGRPRRFSFQPGNALLGGNLPPLATFDLSDAKHYDDEEQFEDLGQMPTLVGGFEVPFAAPISVSRDPALDVPGGIIIGGNARTAPVVTFYGPSLNAKVTIGDVVVALDGTLDTGSRFVVDTRPWSGIARRIGGGTARLARATRLTESTLAPGSYSAVYRSTDETGLSRARVAWRNAWHTL